MSQDRDRKYPTMRPIKVKVSDAPDMHIEATVDLGGRPLVIIVSMTEWIEDIDLRPIEAERLGRALLKAASVARSKITFCKADRNRRGEN